MNNATDSTQPRRSQLWVLIGVFFAPLLIAFLLYYGAGGWRPAGSTNHGDLINPARPLPQVELRDTSGAKFGADVWHGKWTVVYVGDGQCDALCREALTLTRQTRLALGDDMARVQRVFLVTANCCDQAYLDAEQPGLVTVRVDNEAGQKLLATFPAPAVGRIYIVDPLGNLMMSHAPEVRSRGLLEDLKKLLKLSHIG
jgi:hypothetical protein